MNVSDLSKRLSIEILPVYFLKGQDAFMQKKAYGIFANLADGDFAEFNLTYFEDASDINGIIGTVNTSPVFSDRRVVIVKSLEGLDENGKSKLENYLQNPADFSVLVLTDDLLSKEEFFKKESPVHKLYRYGDVVDVSGADDASFARMIGERASETGNSIESKAVARIAEYTGRDMTRAMNETEKLCAYAGGERITADMVDALVTPDTEYKTYELSDALSTGDNRKALSVLASLLENGESAGAVLASLSSQYRRLFETRISPLSVEELAKVFNVRPGAIRIAKNICARYTQVELKKAVDALHGLEYAFKSGRMEESQALYEAFAILLKKR